MCRTLLKNVCCFKTVLPGKPAADGYTLQSSLPSWPCLFWKRQQRKTNEPKQKKSNKNDNKQNRLTNKKRWEIPPIIRHCWGEPISHRSSWNWAIYHEHSNTICPSFQSNQRSAAVLLYKKHCNVETCSRLKQHVFFFFLYRLGKLWNVIFSPFRKQTFKKVTRNEHFVERLWNLTSLGPDTDPADILYRNQRWRIQISTCGDSPLADGGRLTRSGAAGGGSSAETGLWGSRSGPSGTRWAPTG